MFMVFPLTHWLARHVSTRARRCAREQKDIPLGGDRHHRISEGHCVMLPQSFAACVAVDASVAIQLLYRASLNGRTDPQAFGALYVTSVSYW
jgi:hypothetical protein